MASGSVTVPPGEAAAPLNFIYACSVCCYTLADVYEGHDETVGGFSDGINPRDRIVTHLYLASCCHVFCASHLESGAPQFHPEGQRPKAACPTCVKEKNDSTVRDLYSIRGFQNDEHDPMIPPAWFIAPPMSFEGSGKEIEALRFQYLALIRYSQNTYSMRKPQQIALAETENKLVAMQDLASKEHAKVLTLQQENERLQAVERESNNLEAEVERLRDVDREVEQYRRLDVSPKDLETFKNNKDAIRHYLKLVPTLIEQNDKMRERLASVGFAMQLEPVPNLKRFDLDLINDDGGINGDYYGTSGTTLRKKTTSSHTAGRSAHTSGDVVVAPSSPFMQRPSKRQRIESPLPNNMQIDPPSSRDAMPPPSKAASRMRSVRKMFPTLRKKFSSGRSTQASEYDIHSGEDVHMDEDRQWDDPTYGSVRSVRASERQYHHRDGTPYMTGALPVGDEPHGASKRGSQLLSSIGIDNDGPNFTFRAPSPVKMGKRWNLHQPVQLPTEPSYIRLMDGLSGEVGVELGLKDPRESSSNSYRPGNATWRSSSYDHDQHRYGETDQENWSPDLPSQQPPGPHGQSLPRGYRSGAVQPDRTDHRQNGAFQELAHNPMTLAPRKFQQPGHQIENVVSHYIESNNHNAAQFSKPRMAETQDSSNHFAAYRSPRPRMIAPEPGWREWRGLNGLSFFESPVISRSHQQPQRVQDQQQINRPPPSRQYQSRNVTSKGFITRPKAEQSPFFRDSAYGSSRDRASPNRQQHVQTSAAIPFPSFNRSTYSRPSQVPSTMPSIVAGRSPVRTQPQWDALQRVGVRSSRHDFSKNTSNAHGDSTRIIFPSAGRRSVRR
ncbi:hypothetical protein HBI52_126590 [Parastagonospora nodorum]|nr:hypothetical protein HBI32_076080 [Parastagonospora nodorum]KAH5511789.1 hypothetical protein HBI52_126590 [Parastagonospora nodorum]KAH6022593.1 hypothetical protein HBI83_085440 [Parastagonospora nodorum]